ncbi:MAG: hypothetical protein A2X25_10330 [Chloroflexi bacterium GWB2_49_20]|nr:MAG: hypothetical protein A2X25_10330 [Chloroflexi bacterium GWB2_49_20]OGN86200.1 MAG: hypothetical protein A2X27_04755 [Chloroflexi bacterium GWD2_49_16]
METSLGYFINPLFSVFLGVIFLKERLRRWQWFPIILAASQFLIGVFIYHEAFSHFQLVGFGMV